MRKGNDDDKEVKQNNEMEREARREEGERIIIEEALKYEWMYNTGKESEM